MNGAADLHSLCENIGAALRGRAETLAVAESCTGGMIAGALASVPGASMFFWGGAVVYSPDAKIILAGVEAADLERHGTVSAATSAALARGIRARSGATYGLAVTGWAGPSAPPQPGQLGEVHGALCHPDGTTTRRWQLDGDRQRVRQAATEAVLRLLWTRVLATGGGSGD